MAKKKKKQVQTKISDAAYMRSGRARRLPMHECLLNKNWDKSGMASIVVSRKHVNGNFSFATFLVDLYCLGVKDTFFRVNIFPHEYNKLVVDLAGKFEIAQADYAKVHNIIYGAIAYAEDYGFSPFPEFKETKMMLEEDTEEIPLIEYEYGNNGRPQLVVTSDNPKLPFYLSKLEKHAGKGNYELAFLDDFVGESEVEDYGYEPISEDEEDALLDLATFSSEDWEDFIMGTVPGNLHFMRAETLYIYEKTIAAKTIADPNFNVQNIRLTEEPMPGEQSKEEEKQGYEIYKSLFSENISTEEMRQLLTRIKSFIERWPENPIFHNYLINTYIRLGERQNVKEASLAILERFPEYFFGKVTYAQLLIEEGKVDEVPKVFNDQLHIRLAFPEREIFHVSEFISFNLLMSLYYMEQNKLDVAYGYRKMLVALEESGHMHANLKMLFRIDMAVTMKVRELIFDAQEDKGKKETLVAALTA